MPNASLQLADFSQKDKERFWAKVNKDGPIHPYNPAMGSCWLWIASVQNKGYGVLDTNHSGIRKTHLVHRIAFALANGSIGAGMKILHSCDTPRCCNPGHLFEGTQRDNMRDCVSKGRCRSGRHPGARGEKCWLALLTEQKVRDIRRIYAAGGISQERLGEMFGVKRTTILGVVSRRKWAHVM
jgi:hypothetical protein